MPLRTVIRAFGLLLGVALLLTGIATPGAVADTSPGALDPAFGSAGVVTTTQQLFGVAVQSNGEVVAVGDSGGQAVVQRYTTAGTLDPSFGSGGTVTGPGGFARAVAIQSDGKIVVVGGNGGSMYVERLNSNGAPDTSFGSGGVAYALGQNSEGNAVAIQPDGKIVAAGAVHPPVTQLAVVRFSANGAVDGSFGSGGAVLLGGQYSVANGVAVSPDGTIVFAGHQQSASFPGITDALSGRLSSSGVLAGTASYYHPNGGGYSSLNSVAIQTDNSIVLGGVDLENTGPYALFIRLTPAGVPDPTFGFGAVKSSSASTVAAGFKTSTGDPTGAYGVGIAGGGRLVAAGGYEDTATDVDAAMWAVGPDGTPEGNAFDDGSTADGSTVRGPSIGYEACALAVAPDGNLVSVGDTVTSYPDANICAVNAKSQGFVERRIGYGPAPVRTVTPPPPPAKTPPAAISGTAKSVTEVSARTTGEVNPNGQGTSYHVDWGFTKKYGTSTAAVSAGAGVQLVPVAATLSRLKPHTTYHYRIVAASTGGTSYGSDETFTTVRRLAITSSGLLKRYSLASVLAHGITTTIRCSQACRVRATMSITSAIAKQLKLGSKPLTIGSGDFLLRKAGKKTLVVRLTRAAQRAAQRLHSFIATLRIRTNPHLGGPATTFTRTITLHH